MNNKKVILGIENIDQYADLFKNKRVGLITNPTGITSDFESSIDVLRKKVNLVALFSPEHGVRASIQAGMHLDTYVDEETNITVYSLYGATKKPSKEIMDKLDVMCIDIQDNGSRYYTFIYTMAYAMMACAENDKEFVVFDRPNPIGGAKVEGNHLNIEKYRSFVGYYDIPQRHGMTIGELAKLFNTEFGINCKLHIIPLVGWNRHDDFNDTLLPWIIPTPNIPTVNTCYAYNATCVFEGTNVAEGRGTTTPFELIGAPWLNSERLAAELNSYHLKGVYFRPQWFTPTFSKYQNELCGGVFLHITDKEVFDSMKTSWTLLYHIRNKYNNYFKINAPYVKGRPGLFEYEVGDENIINNSISLEEQFDLLDQAKMDFIKLRKPYLLYEVKND